MKNVGVYQFKATINKTKFYFPITVPLISRKDPLWKDKKSKSWATVLAIKGIIKSRLDIFLMYFDVKSITKYIQ